VKTTRILQAADICSMADVGWSGLIRRHCKLSTSMSLGRESDAVQGRACPSLNLDKRCMECLSRIGCRKSELHLTKIPLSSIGTHHGGCCASRCKKRKLKAWRVQTVIKSGAALMGYRYRNLGKSRRDCASNLSEKHTESCIHHRLHHDHAEDEAASSWDAYKLS
jgi:hypothetical protein